MSHKAQHSHEAESLDSLPMIEKSTTASTKTSFQAATPEATYLAQAELAAAHIEGIASDLSPLKINQVAVIGAGTMGRGIAMSFASTGFQVILIESRAEALGKALTTIRGQFESRVSKGKLTEAEMQIWMSRIQTSLHLDEAASAELIIEAVFEDMAVKRELFGKLDQIVQANAILATNTSRLDINHIAAATTRPERVIGMHFFSPAHIMRLVEVVRGELTDPVVQLTAMDVTRQIGKLPVLVGVCDGFVGNRMSACYAREAEFLLEEGASPQQVDQALQNFGMAMGRFTVVDLAGLDISYASRKRLAATRPVHLRYSKVSDRLCEMGRLGQKSGAGFYRYEPGSRVPLNDPVADQVIERCAAEAGIVRRAITESEIIERTIYTLINEGAKVLQDNIAQRASDIDLIFANGYGFPVRRGGPMFFANSIGLDKVYQRICEFREKHGEFWEPAPLLRELALSGRKF
jgi:3-hydroxyacyl-CoA dehydrogenase